MLFRTPAVVDPYEVSLENFFAIKPSSSKCSDKFHLFKYVFNFVQHQKMFLKVYQLKVLSKTTLSLESDDPSSQFSD